METSPCQWFIELKHWQRNISSFSCWSSASQTPAATTATAATAGTVGTVGSNGNHICAANLPSRHACLAGEVGNAVAKPSEIGDLEMHSMPKTVSGFDKIVC